MMGFPCRSFVAALVLLLFSTSTWAQATGQLGGTVFNLFNNFNWGDPNTSFGAGTFGQITSQSGDPRIMQFGLKYGF